MSRGAAVAIAVRPISSSAATNDTAGITASNDQSCALALIFESKTDACAHAPLSSGCFGFSGSGTFAAL